MVMSNFFLEGGGGGLTRCIVVSLKIVNVPRAFVCLFGFNFQNGFV